MEIATEDGEVIDGENKVLWKQYVERFFKVDKRPEILGIGDESEVCEEEKGCYILEGEVEKALKEMNRKACGDDEVPAELWKGLVKRGIRDMTSLCNFIYESGDWPKDFVTTIMVPIKKKSNTLKCEEYSLILHAAKILLRLLNGRIYGRLERSIGEEQFGFRMGREQGMQ
ncbi:uncharacterized protein LOC142333606 [Lycorma delicatula]|uniref:uncharacterized protein LOC142333606 n=1 Tax=Lycorma delicatula TaxID=130591 RepID=UPI003F518B0C